VRMRPIKNAFQVVLMLMGLVAVGLLSAIATMSIAIHGAEVQVPALTGMTVADARSQTAGLGHGEREAALALRRVGLEVGVTARLPYSDAAEGTVIAQDPPAHAQGIARPSVNLLVAAASDDVPDGFLMPELVGLPFANAQALLARVGIHTAAPTMVNVAVPPVGSEGQPIRPPVKPGSVLSQVPMAGARVDQSTLVHLSVAQ